MEGGMADELLEIILRILPFTLSDIQSHFQGFEQRSDMTQQVV